MFKKFRNWARDLEVAIITTIAYRRWGHYLDIQGGPDSEEVILANLWAEVYTQANSYGREFFEHRKAHNMGGDAMNAGWSQSPEAD